MKCTVLSVLLLVGIPGSPGRMIQGHFGGPPTLHAALEKAAGCWLSHPLSVEPGEFRGMDPSSPRAESAGWRAILSDVVIRPGTPPVDIEILFSEAGELATVIIPAGIPLPVSEGEPPFADLCEREAIAILGWPKQELQQSVPDVIWRMVPPGFVQGGSRVAIWPRHATALYDPVPRTYWITHSLTHSIARFGVVHDETLRCAMGYRGRGHSAAGGAVR